jgi:hypothetical protein
MITRKKLEKEESYEEECPGWDYNEDASFLQEFKNKHIDSLAMEAYQTAME